MENRVRVVNNSMMNIITKASNVEPGRYICISMRRGGVPKITACDTTSGKAMVRKTDSISYAWEWLLNRGEQMLEEHEAKEDNDRLMRRKRWSCMSPEQKRAARSNIMDRITELDPMSSMTLREVLEDITEYAIGTGRNYPEPCQLVQDFMEFDGLPAALAIALAGHHIGYWQIIEPVEDEPEAEGSAQE